MIELRDTLTINVVPEVLWDWLQSMPDHYLESHPDHLSARRVHDDALVRSQSPTPSATTRSMFRTTSFSEVGTYICGAEVAFEIDDIDISTQTGTSVVVHGRAEAVDDAQEIREIQQHDEPVPWAGGRRDPYIRIPIEELTGHAVRG